MATQDIDDRGRGSDVASKLEYNFLFAACLAVCLPAVVVQRTYRLVRGLPSSASRESIFSEARSAASAATGYAFSI